MATSPSHTALLRHASRLQEALAELTRVLKDRDRDRAHRYSLSVSQCHAVQALARWGPLTVNELAARLFLEKSTASRLADSLLGKGLVRKRAPASDGRVVILQVTETGHRLSRRILNDLTEEYMDLLEGLSRDQGEALLGALELLVEAMTVRPGNQDPSSSTD